MLRASLEQRGGEFLADAAVTPQAFVQQSRRIMSSYAPARLDRPSSVVITPEDAQPAVPASFGPSLPSQEEVTEV